jgi:hypothetical protein
MHDDGALGFDRPVGRQAKPKAMLPGTTFFGGLPHVWNEWATAGMRKEIATPPWMGRRRG